LIHFYKRLNEGQGMPVCKFYMSGVCKFGSHCRNKHPDPWPGYLAQLSSQLPHRVEDNLSEDFKFFIPSPTVTTDKIFYSSDSDWDEEAEGHNSSNIAIVPCERCGLLELKPLPDPGERYLCDKCREERRGSRVVGLDLEQQQEQDKKKKTRRFKKKKKKAPVVAQTVESDLLAFEGTPEGVKVYRLKEGSQNQVDIVSTNNNNRSESQSSQNSEKGPCANISEQIFKVQSDLEEPPSEIVQSCEEIKEVSEGTSSETEPIALDISSLKHLILQTGLLMIVVLYESNQNWLYFIGGKVKSYLSDMKQVILNWWNSSGASKPGKYSRRRKIFK